MNAISLNDFDLFSTDINFIIKGKRAIKTLAGGLISFIVVACFWVICVGYIMLNSNSVIQEMIIKNSTYSEMTNTVSLYSKIKSTIALLENKSNQTQANILFTTDPNSIIDEYDIKNAYTVNSFLSNADILMFGILLINTTDNSVISINITENNLLNFNIKLEKYNYTVDYNKNIVNSVLLDSKLVENYKIVECSNLFNDSVLKTNNSMINFNYTLNNYPYLSMFQCLEYFNLEVIKPFKNVSSNSYIDYKISFNLDLCYSELNKNCNYDYVNVLNKLNTLTVHTYTLKRNYKSKTLVTFIPYLKSIQMNNNYLKQVSLTLKSNYFYDVPFNLFTGSNVSPFFSTLDLVDFTSTTTYLGKTLELSNKISTIFKFEVSIVDDLNQTFYFYQKILYDIGMMANILFLFYFLGKIVFYIFNKDKYLDYVMNEIMIIIDPKDNDKIELMNENVFNYDKGENEINVRQNEYLGYQEIDKREFSTKNDKNNSSDKRGDQISQNSYIKVGDTSDIIENRKFQYIKPKSELENTLRDQENLIFQQINRYNLNEKFSINYKDVLKNSKQKLDVYERARNILYVNTNISNILLNFNTFKFMINKILFPEYQYFMLKYLSTHVIIGDYVIGYSLDHFFSRFDEKRQWEMSKDKFRRSFQKFRKNLKFRKYDKKVLNLCKIHTQENLIENFKMDLKNYFTKSK